MSDPLTPPPRPETPCPDLNLRCGLRIDPEADVLTGRKTLQYALNRPDPDRPSPSLGNYLRPNEELDPVLRHHLRR